MSKNLLDNNYNAAEIEILEGLEPVRHRPGWASIPSPGRERMSPPPRPSPESAWRSPSQPCSSHRPPSRRRRSEFSHMRNAADPRPGIRRPRIEDAEPRRWPMLDQRDSFGAPARWRFRIPIRRRYRKTVLARNVKSHIDTKSSLRSYPPSHATRRSPISCPARRQAV